MRAKLRRLYSSKIKIAGIVILLFLLAIGAWKLIAWGQQFKKTTGLSATTIFSLIVNGGAPIASTGGRTNILVLGIGGGTHEGADLTDTMLVVSLEKDTHSVAFISVPRDTWSDTLQDKINTAYHYGEEKQKGGGLILAKAITEDVVGMPIHYAFVIDFSGFTKIIDLVGGVDVTVPKAFTDTQYPIEGKENDLCGGDSTYGCRYETIHFNAGLVHMNGSLALKYVRSRHAEGDEGSDFARSKRQQDVLVAIRKKVLKPSLLLHPSLDIKLLRAFDDATNMDMTIGELLTVGKLLSTTKPEAIKRISFDNQLINPPLEQYGGRYVLVPQESFDVIHAYIKSKL